MSTVHDRIRRLAGIGSVTQVQGHWISVQYRPNLMAGEALNIGVAFIDAATKRACVKLLDEIDKIGVLFGEQLESEIRFALRSVAACFDKSRIESPSENITFSEPRFASGNSAEEILEQVFSSTVRLLSAYKEAGPAPRVFTGNEKVRKQVFDSIRLRAGVKAEQILAEIPIYKVKDGGREYSLDIPLRGGKHLGSVVSAAYASRNSLETNLLRASIDLETASRVFHQDRLGLFVLRPSVDDQMFGTKQHLEIDNVIDMLSWKLHKQGFTVGVEDDAQRLAGEVLEWCQVEA
jgi:hypothetical protein